MQEGKAHLRQGRWVIIFPQGTRVTPGTEQRFHLGAARLAVEAGVPLVPIAHNAGLFWGRRQLRKRAGRIELRIGPAIDPTGKDVVAVNAAAEQWIQRTLEGLPQTAEVLRPVLAAHSGARQQ